MSRPNSSLRQPSSGSQLNRPLAGLTTGQGSGLNRSGKQVDQVLGRLVDQGQQSHRRILKHRDEHVDPAIPEADYSR